MISRTYLTRMPSKGQPGQRFSWNHLGHSWNHLKQGLCEITYSLRPLTWSSLSQGRNDFTNIFDPDASQRPTGSTIFVKSFRPPTAELISHKLSNQTWPKWIQLRPCDKEDQVSGQNPIDFTKAMIQMISKTAQVIPRKYLTRLAFWRHPGQICSWNHFGLVAMKTRLVA